MPFILKNYSLVESVYLFIRCNKTKFFLRSTNNTDVNGVNNQNTHQALRGKSHWKWGVQQWAWMVFNFCF